ncbi:hypothetical protein MKEN_01313700 [Mycena kentingensis (nom. inval.)]|nr:hypothetical protein MKEN_01313700 [Mycena kentingensis (nom. inval.)]
MPSVDILIIGAGWTSTFLIPLCDASNISYAATTRSGAPNTIKFEFQPESDDQEPYKALPGAKTVLITFPITLPAAAARLVRLYLATHDCQPGFTLLGTTSIYDKATAGSGDNVYDRHSPFNLTSRASAEVELLALSPQTPTTVLNLAGLWGGKRIPRNWVERIAPTKDALKAKGSVHFIHGIDVARAILAVHTAFDKAAGQRWLITDGRVYDWWDLASAWFPEGEVAKWVQELMREEDVRVLPRDSGMLGRILDSREFWSTFGIAPMKARLELAGGTGES